MKAPREIAKLAQIACILEVCADKPGNVSFLHDFSDTLVLDYLLSSIAVGTAFENATHLSVGQIIQQAIEDTQQSVKSNTNLGIILLLAPLVKACHGARDMESIRTNLRSILRSLSVKDAQHAYAAIRRAKASGLGNVPEADISEEPSITLLQAMALAEGRDSIASEYTTDFAITFEIGLPAMREALAKGAEFPIAVVQAYLTILTRIPDTLIARKNGGDVAREVSWKAGVVLNQGGVFTASGRTAIAELDRNLRDRAHALNPGTTADLTTAAIFLALTGFET